jgi:hypothetical protein
MPAYLDVPLNSRLLRCGQFFDMDACYSVSCGKLFSDGAKLVTPDRPISMKGHVMALQRGLLENKTPQASAHAQWFLLMV